MLRQQFGSRQAVAMLAGKRTAKFRNQIGDIRHRGAESGDARAW